MTPFFPFRLLAEVNKKRENEGLFKVLLHTDAAQAIGKVPVDVTDLNIDYLTIVGHKVCSSLFSLHYVGTNLSYGCSFAGMCVRFEYRLSLGRLLDPKFLWLLYTENICGYKTYAKIIFSLFIRIYHCEINILIMLFSTMDLGLVLFISVGLVRRLQFIHFCMEEGKNEVTGLAQKTPQ